MSILGDTVLGALRHGVRHGQVIHHHNVLVGLVDGGGGGLCARSDGGVVVLYGGTWRLELWPLEKLVMCWSRSSCKW